MPKASSNVLSQLSVVQIHELGAAGICDVGDVKSAVDTACQMPGQKRINVAKNHVAGFSELPNAGHMFEQPADFQAAEVSAERQSSLGAKAVRAAVAGKLCDVVVDTCVLPNNRVGHRLAGFSVPQNRSFALVSNADCCEIGGAKIFLLQCLRDDRLGGVPDLVGIMFNPSGLGINLFVLFLG